MDAEELSQDGWQPRGVRVITVGHIRTQLEWIANRPTDWEAQQDQWDPRALLILNWTAPEAPASATASGIGAYSRWLVALELLTAHCEPTVDVAKNLGVSSQSCRQLFDPKIDEDKRLLRSVERYTLTYPSKRTPELDIVLWRILDGVNGLRRGAAVSALDVATFLELPVPVSPSSPVVGSEPLQGFRHWLHYGVRPNRVLGSNVNREGRSSIRVEAASSAIMDALRSRKAHQSILNIWSAGAAESTDMLGEALEGRLPAKLVNANRAFSIVRVSLGPGASRSGVLRSLLAQLEAETVVDLPQSIRDSDRLNRLRAHLSSIPVIVLLEHWDNASGPLSALDNFLCDTDWSEFLRVLGQPLHSSTEVAHGRAEASLLVVLSSSPATELKPWCVDLLECSGVDARSSETKYPSRDEAIEGLLNSQVARTYVTVAARLIAASVNGMQRSTLRRCLKQWVALFGKDALPKTEPSSSREQLRGRLRAAIEKWDDPYQSDELVQRLLATGLVVELTDNESDGLTNSVRRVELNRRPEPPRPASASPEDGKLLQFASRAARSDFVRAWRLSEGEPSQAQQGRARAMSWSAIHYVVAEESLRQATVLVRHQEPRAWEDASILRRFAQATYHGLMGVEDPLESDVGLDPISGGLYATAIPVDPDRRYRFLYRFVYRRCLEGGEWRLGRSLGRSDVRLELLTLFLRPSTGADLLQRETGRDAQTRLLPEIFKPEKEIGGSDPTLRCDLLEALARSGLDVGTKRGRDAAAWAISMLPGWKIGPSLDPNVCVPVAELHEINRRLPPRGDAFARAADAAMKLRIDWLQSSGETGNLVIAEGLCQDQLGRMGIDPSLLDALFDAIAQVLKKASSDTEGVTTGLAAAMDACAGQILGAVQPVAARVLVADILFRKAEIIATRADSSASMPASSLDEANRLRQELLKLFANACAVYRVADRVRSSVGTDEAHSLSWPAAGARSLRYYVRACLKLARLLLPSGEHSGSGRLTDLSEALLEHAQSRLGVYTRHHFRHHRERVSAMLLESARIRTWVRVACQLSLPFYSQTWHEMLAQPGLVLDVPDESAQFGAARSATAALRTRRRTWPKRLSVSLDQSIQAYVETLEGQWVVLRESEQRLEEARKLLLELGFQRAHVRRLYLEQAKLATTALSVALSYERAPLFASKPAGIAGADSAAPFQSQQSQLKATYVKLLQVRLRQRLGELAKRHRLSERLLAGEEACAALEACSSGDPFWSQISQRQNTSLGLARIRVTELLQAAPLTSPRD